VSEEKYYSLVAPSHEVGWDHPRGDELKLLSGQDTPQEDMWVEGMVGAEEGRGEDKWGRESDLITKSSGKFSRNFLSPPNLSFK
jgi:hypothetical protein